MAKVEQDTVLQLQRRFDAPRERVFDAWTNPQVLREWWAAGDLTPGDAEIDLREGGRYRLSMVTSSGETHTVSGEYKEVRAPERLAYTWAWEMGPEVMNAEPVTLVEVDFEDDGGGTTVTLTHTGFSSAQTRDMHSHGWSGTLDNLERVLAK
jgi:glutathione S-transferase